MNKFASINFDTYHKGISLNHTLSALDESGSLHTIFSMAKPGKEYLIIGKDLVSTLIYGKCIRNAIGHAA